MLDFCLIFSSEMSRQNEPKVGGQYVYKVLYEGSKVTVTLYITKAVNTSVFVIYRPRKFVFAIRLGSMLTIIICYVLCRQYCALSWSMTFYTYDFCISKNRCMIDQTYH
jgi:hypothetical protein